MMKIDLPEDGTVERARMRAVSTVVFGGAFDLEALVAMARAKRFYLGELEPLVGCTGSYLSKFIRQLAEVGLLEAEHAEDGQRRKYYSTASASLWPMVDRWAREFDPPGAGAVTRIA